VFSRQRRGRDSRRRTWRGCRTGEDRLFNWRLEDGEEGGQRRVDRAGEAKDKPGAEADEVMSTEDGKPGWEDGRHTKANGKIKSIA
jgi:hypothetical protein